MFGIANMKFEFAVQDAIKNPKLKPHRPETLTRERERWGLLKIPRCDIDGVGEGK